jgi:hypothetical protein
MGMISKQKLSFHNGWENRQNDQKKAHQSVMCEGVDFFMGRAPFIMNLFHVARKSEYVYFYLEVMKHLREVE